MDTIADDLVLLLLGSSGLLERSGLLPFALAGSELVRLADVGAVSVESGRIVVRPGVPVTDPALSTALASVAGHAEPPVALDWVTAVRDGIAEEYLGRLAEAGVVERESHRFFGARWYVIDPARLAAAERRLDHVVRSGEALSASEAAFAGLARSVGLERIYYAGWRNRHLRRRFLERDATVPAWPDDRGGVPADGAGDPAGATPRGEHATNVSVDVAVHASVQAAVSAAVTASITAAEHAVVAEQHHAVHVTHDAGGHHSG